MTQAFDHSICSTCERLLHLDDNVGTFPHHPDLLVLAWSAKECMLCKLINKHLVTAARRTVGKIWLRRLRNSELGVSTAITASKRMAYQALCFRFSCSMGPRVFHTPEICIGSLWTLGPLARRPIWHSQDGCFFGSRVTTIVDWLTDCTSNHPLCSSSTSIPSLPTRILDLGPPGQDGDPVLRESNGKRGIYSALSHRWGIRPPLTTVRATLDLRMSGISSAELPKTFQDAIYVTRALGIRYIWIDSLCIIQDDKRDWEAESSRMAAVYENAHLTLSASAAAHGGAGCLRDFQPSARFESQGITYFARVASAENFEATTQDGFKPIAPLAQRGWAFQESLLSRRVLHFGKRQLSWKCVMRHTSEDGIKDISDPDLKGAAAFGDDSTPVGLRTYLQMKDNTERYNSWSRLIEHYSARKFTFDKDRLIALAGIVSVFQSLSNDIPLAGLWKHDLHRSLLWEVASLGKATKGNAEYGIPSWSWAYVDTPVQFPEPTEVELCQVDVVESTVTYSGQYLTSRIMVASLHIEGVFGEAIIGRRDLRRSNTCFLHPVQQHDNCSGNLNPAFGYCHFDFDPYPSGSLICFMVISTDISGTCNTLLLRAVDGLACSSAFSRVGVGRIMDFLNSGLKM